MPLYDYECTACGAIEEVRHGFGGDHTEACAKCGGVMRRRLSATGIVFKGSGFYITDSRGKGESGAKSGGSKSTPSTSTEAPSAAGTAAETSSAAPAEPKPAASAETKPSSTSDAA